MPSPSLATASVDWMPSKIRGAFRDPVGWPEENRQLKGKPFRFTGLEPWKPVLRSPATHLLVYKPRKVTFSEQIINLMLTNLASAQRSHGAYLFPTQDVANRFSDQRIKPAIQGCPYLLGMLCKDNVETKAFRRYLNTSTGRELFDQLLFLIGAEVAGGTTSQEGDRLRSTELDWIAYDERQLMGWTIEEVVGQAAALSRYRHAPRHTITGGTPTVEGGILDLLYLEQSTAKALKVKCPACKSWNDFDDSTILLPGGQPAFDGERVVRFEGAYCGCPSCLASLDGLRGTYGKSDGGGNVEWVAEYPNENRRYDGYRFSRIGLNPVHPETGEILFTIDGYLQDLRDAKTPRTRENEVRGRSYSGADVPFPYALLLRSTVPSLSLEDVREWEYAYVKLTVDWGIPTWYYCEGVMKNGVAVFLGWGRTHDDDERKHPQEIHKAVCRLPINVVMADEGHAVGRIRTLRELFGEKVLTYGVRYTSAEAKSQADKEKLTVKITEGFIEVDRSWAIERLQAMLYHDDDESGRSWIIPFADKDKVDLFLRHFPNIRLEEESVEEAGIFREIKHTKSKYGRIGPDHLFHCKLYASLADPKLGVKVRRGVGIGVF